MAKATSARRGHQRGHSIHLQPTYTPALPSPQGREIHLDAAERVGVYRQLVAHMKEHFRWGARWKGGEADVDGIVAANNRRPRSPREAQRPQPPPPAVTPAHATKNHAGTTRAASAAPFTSCPGTLLGSTATAPSPRRPTSRPAARARSYARASTWRPQRRAGRGGGVGVGAGVGGGGLSLLCTRIDLAAPEARRGRG